MRMTEFVVDKRRSLSGAVVGLFLTFGLLFGCAGSGSGSGATSGTRTGGLNLELTVRGPDGERAQYVLQEEGVLSFSGGRDMVLGQVTWTGDLSDDEIGKVLDTIQSVGWLEVKPASMPDSDEYVYTIDLESPKQTASWTITGDSPYVRPVYVVLDQVSRKRFDSYVDRLPKPSLDEHMEEIARQGAEGATKTEP
ncbi:MAG: hypothetical protein P8J86_03470 [Phycisphaerales bacterium]|nr:hypothetical protein [Phycisphaerales bacterium]